MFSLTKKTILFLAIVVGSLSQILVAQNENKKENGFGVEGYGWVSGMYFYDTRQTSYLREGMLSSYPLPIKLDQNGKDLNARPTSNFNASSTRVGAKIYSPDIFGAKTMGTIEGDFTGQAEANIHLLRLRQAHITLDWGSTKLLIGHSWSPLFVMEMTPSIQDLHNGGPFHPFSRTNQIRLDQTLCSGFKLVATAGFQRDYSSYGVNGLRSPFNQINSNIPEFNLQLHYKNENLFAGIGGEYKAIRPRNDDTLGNKVYQQTTLVHSYAATAFLNYKYNAWDFKLQGVWGENLNDYNMLGGFVGSKMNPINNTFSYATTQIASAWMDLSYNIGNFSPALFIGYQKNLGYDANFVVDKFYGLSSDIDNIYRVATRLDYFATKSCSFTAQAEYTAAAYGNYQKQTSEVLDAKYIGNYRFSLLFCYKFSTGRK